MSLNFNKPIKPVGIRKKTPLSYHKREDIDKFNRKNDESQAKDRSIVQAKPMKDLKDSLSPAQVNQLLTNALNHNPRDYLLMLCLYLTGRRISEALNLQQQDIDFENKMILWSILKKKDRNYQKFKPCPQLLLDDLKEFVKNNGLQPQDYIFFGSFKGKTKPMTRQTAHHLIHKYGKEIGLDIHPHSFRHSFAVNMVRNMRSPSGLIILQDSLEHSDISMTRHYLQFSQEETRDLQESLAGKLSSNENE